MKKKKRGLSFKSKLIISIIVDAVDLILTFPQILLYLSGIGLPVGFLVNHIKGIVYDGFITIPISYYLFGSSHKVFLAGIELLIPDELDSFIPTLTLITLINYLKDLK